MAENKKYVALFWHQKIPIEKPNIPLQTVETINKPRIKGRITPVFSRGMAKGLSDGFDGG